MEMSRQPSKRYLIQVLPCSEFIVLICFVVSHYELLLHGFVTSMHKGTVSIVRNMRNSVPRFTMKKLDSNPTSINFSSS